MALDPPEPSALITFDPRSIAFVGGLTAAARRGQARVFYLWKNLLPYFLKIAFLPAPAPSHSYHTFPEQGREGSLFAWKCLPAGGLLFAFGAYGSINDGTGGELM